MPDVLSVEGFGKRYGAFRAAAEISFRLAPGEVVGLCGPNGAGKTTTLRAIAGIVQPSEGRILVAGHDIVEAPLDAKRQLAFVPDEPAVFDHLTVHEHLRLTARLYRVKDGDERAGALIDDVELGPKRDELAAGLSRGMKQKLMLACALIHRPRLLLLDEPLTGLDPLAIRRTAAASTRPRNTRRRASKVATTGASPSARLCHAITLSSASVVESGGGWPGAGVSPGLLPDQRA